MSDWPLHFIECCGYPACAMPPESSVGEHWTERAYHNLIHFNALARGGHFAAWEQPQLFSEEVRTGFRSLRK